MKRSERLAAASFNNRKKQLVVTYVSGKTVTVHFRQLGIAKNIAEVAIDRETKGASLRITFRDGETDYMPYDQPLALTHDPDFTLQNQIERLVARLKSVIADKGISKKFLAAQLQTSENQLYRLLDPTILNKNLAQLYRLAALLDLEIELKTQRVA